MQRSAWFLYYSDGSKLYQRCGITVTVMAPGGIIGFYYREGSVTHLPRTAHMITSRKIGEFRWTQYKHRVVMEDIILMRLPGMMTASSLANEGKKATSASNGSLY